MSRRASAPAPGFVLRTIAALVLGLATVGHGDVDDSAEMTPRVPTGVPRGISPQCCCDTPVDCGSYCCEPGDTCNFNVLRGCCPSDRPTPCPHDCCPAHESCGADGFCQPRCAPGQVSCGDRCCAAGTTCNPYNFQCCPAGNPIACPTTCCPLGGTCPASGNSCGAVCPGGTVDCFNGFCCPFDNSCNTINPQHTICCTPGFPVQCYEGCCAETETCNPVNPELCCRAGYPIPCAHTCCPAGYECTPDGNDCYVPCAPPGCLCSDPSYPVACGNGFCCPFGDRCEVVTIANERQAYCCFDLPDDGCCNAPDLAETLGSTRVAQSVRGGGGGGGQCRKSTKVRPFEILQVPGSFDLANHQYSVGFALGGKKGRAPVVLKVPIIREDSNSATVAVMIPPFLLTQKDHGKADVFLVTDGVTSDTCLSRVRIAKLPKSPSKGRGLTTLSWLRANQAVYTTAKPTLASAGAAPFVNPEVLTDVDTVITNVAGLIAEFGGSGGATAVAQRASGGVAHLDPGAEVGALAKVSDRFFAGVLNACQRVGDPAFASACGAWVQALARARDANDASLVAAEAAYAAALLGASGPSAQSVAKFGNASVAVATAGVAASAALIAGGASPSTGTDAQAATAALAGATLSATTTVCGLNSIIAGASAPASGRTAFGKTLLQGTLQASTAARTNYGGINIGSAKVCGCREPRIKRITDICITIIETCDHTRRRAPRFCLPDGRPQPAPGFTPGMGRCDEPQFSDSTAPDTRTIDLGPVPPGTVFFFADPGRTPNTFVVRRGAAATGATGATRDILIGDILFRTGCVSAAYNAVPIQTGADTKLTVEVTECAGQPQDVGTSSRDDASAPAGFTTHNWTYIVSCGD